MLGRRLATMATCGAAAALACSGLGVAGPASASTGWTIQSMPIPSNATGRGIRVDGVSCVAGGFCMAVGGYPTTLANNPLAPLAELKTSSTGWKVVTVPEPAGVSEVELPAVSCTSAAFCIAVSNDSAGGLLAEIWNGTSWTVQSVPSPPQSSGAGLASVSCSSPTSCMAVGAYSTPSVVLATLAERWDGTSWTIVPTADGQPYADLSSVSCPTGSFCAAVGNEGTGAGQGSTLLSETWNGSIWATQPLPAPANVYRPIVEGVSCSSPSACTAAGWSFLSQTSNQMLGLGDRWDGTQWTLNSPPDPTLSATSVSCAPDGACTVLGFTSPAIAPVAEHRSSTGHWTAQDMPTQPNTARTTLQGLSCLSATSCTAVGYYNRLNPRSGGIPLAEHE